MKGFIGLQYSMPPTKPETSTKLTNYTSNCFLEKSEVLGSIAMFTAQINTPPYPHHIIPSLIVRMQQRH